MNLREKLLANHPKITPIIINGDTFYIREITVGEMNRVLYGQPQITRNPVSTSMTENERKNQN